MSERFTEHQRLLIKRLLRRKAMAAKAGRAVEVIVDSTAGDRLASVVDRAGALSVSADVAKAIVRGHVHHPVVHGRRHQILGPATSKETLNRVSQALEAGSAATGAFKSPSLSQPHIISRAVRQID